MNDIDEFSTRLFEEAKRFLEKANLEASPDGKRSYLHAALLLGFSALEAHLNSIAEEMNLRGNLSVLDRSVLSERDYTLEGGHFQLNNKLKMYRLEDRLSHLFANFSIQEAEKISAQPWWSPLNNGISLRNKLVHPKDSHTVDASAVANALTAILQCLGALYMSIYGRPLPSLNRGLQSIFDF